MFAVACSVLLRFLFCEGIGLVVGVGTVAYLLSSSWSAGICLVSTVDRLLLLAAGGVYCLLSLFAAVIERSCTLHSTFEPLADTN